MTMELNQQNTVKNTILEYDELSLQIADNSIQFPCFVGVNYWQKIEQLSAGVVGDLIRLESTELLFIGSSKPTPIKEQMIIKKVINCEFMNISAAIHSFNLLISDQRLVGLIILT